MQKQKHLILMQKIYGRAWCIFSVVLHLSHPPLPVGMVVTMDRDGFCGGGRENKKKEKL